MKIFLFVLGLVAAALVFAVYRNRTVRVSKETRFGPFVIRAESVTGRTFNANYGMVKTTTVWYSILFEGRPIEFPAHLQSNTGLPFLWKVYALADAPEPTLLAGSQSLYLVYLKDGQPVVEPLVEQGSDFATLQFLDSEAGQPGEEITVFSHGKTEDMGKLDSLQGGQWLLVSGHLVLEVASRKTWAFSLGSNSLDNYSFPTPNGALAFSPDHSSIVFNGSFQSWNTQTEDLPESEHAMVVFDFQKDKGYTVKYDDTETRLTDVNAIHPNWFAQVFEWEKGVDGADLLRRKDLDKPINWLGKYLERDQYYYLYPVKPSMHPVFLDFVLRQMGWTSANILKDTTTEYSGRRIELGDDHTKLDIGFKEDEQEISFSKNLYLPDSADKLRYQVLVKKITDAFDAELAAGRHQEHFGRIMSETQRNRSL